MDIKTWFMPNVPLSNEFQLLKSDIDVRYNSTIAEDILKSGKNYKNHLQFIDDYLKPLVNN